VPTPFGPAARLIPNGGPRPHGVVAVIRDPGGRFLCIQRAHTLKRAPGWWCFVGGEVEPGETLAEALEREVLEEVGLRAHPGDKIYECLAPGGSFLLHWVEARIAPVAAWNLNPAEVADARWLLAREILTLEPALPTLTAWVREKLASGELG
jgi:8-oxo-dGTP diphosphatase